MRRRVLRRRWWEGVVAPHGRTSQNERTLCEALKRETRLVRRAFGARGRGRIGDDGRT